MASPEGGESQAPCVCCDCRFFDCAYSLDDDWQIVVSDGQRGINDDVRDEKRDKGNNHLRHCGVDDCRGVYCSFSLAFSLNFPKDVSEKENFNLVSIAYWMRAGRNAVAA